MEWSFGWGSWVMRVISKLLAVTSLLFSCSAANAKTVYFDISGPAGFTHNGIGGIFGNGIVFLSPIYQVGRGATVDFGTAFVTPDDCRPEHSDTQLDRS
jgi:hypothetical protein